MIVTNHFPSAPLNAYIDSMRYCDGPAPYRHLKVLPNPSLNLMINFDDAYHCYRAGQVRPYSTCAESWSVGLWNTHHILDWPHNMQLFVVDFKPGGAHPFLHLPLSELHNAIVPMDVIWGHLAVEVRERLYDAPTIQARFALLEQLLLARLREVPHELDAVCYAVAEIARTGVNVVYVGSAIYLQPDPAASYQRLVALARGDQKEARLNAALLLGIYQARGQQQAAQELEALMERGGR